MPLRYFSVPALVADATGLAMAPGRGHSPAHVATRTIRSRLHQLSTCSQSVCRPGWRYQLRRLRRLPARRRAWVPCSVGHRTCWQWVPTRTPPGKPRRVTNPTDVRPSAGLRGGRHPRAARWPRASPNSPSNPVRMPAIPLRRPPNVPVSSLRVRSACVSCRRSFAWASCRWLQDWRATSSALGCCDGAESQSRSKRKGKHC